MSPAKTELAPVTDAELERVPDLARSVEELGVAGAPMAAFGVAQVAGRIASELKALRQKLERVTAESRRWYRADGSFEELRTSAEVVLRRVAAAQEIEVLREKVTVLHREAYEALDAARKANAEVGRANELLERERETSRRLAEKVAELEARSAA